MRAEVPSRALVTFVLLVAVGCASCKKKNGPSTLETTDAREIYERSIAELQQDDLRQARSLLERIDYSADDRGELEPLVRLAIADATFYEEQGLNLIDARSLYLDFVALYGAHRLAPYAQMQAGVCSLLQVANPTRDQSLTFQAIADLRVTEQRWPDSPFARAARSMIHRAETNLAEHEFLVGRFYLKHKAPLAAVERFERIVDRYPHYDEMEKVYFHLGQAQLKLGNESEALIYLDKVIQDYPGGPYSKDARRELNRVERGKSGFDLADSD